MENDILDCIADLGDRRVFTSRRKIESEDKQVIEKAVSIAQAEETAFFDSLVYNTVKSAKFKYNYLFIMGFDKVGK